MLCNNKMETQIKWQNNNRFCRLVSHLFCLKCNVERAMCFWESMNTFTWSYVKCILPDLVLFRYQVMYVCIYFVLKWESRNRFETKWLKKMTNKCRKTVSFGTLLENEFTAKKTYMLVSCVHSLFSLGTLKVKVTII